MPGVLTWLMGLGVMVLDSALLSRIWPGWLAVQPALIVTVFLGLRREFVHGALVFCALLPVMDVLAGSPGGYEALSLVVVFGMARALQRNLQAGFGLAYVGFSVVAALTHGLVLTGISALSDPTTRVGEAVWDNLAAACLGSLVAAPLWGLSMQALDQRFKPRGSGRSRLVSAI